MGNNILGLGNDIIEIDRIRKSIATHQERFLNRIFTPKEQAYCLTYKDPAPHFAARFAAKEAVAKALGCGLGEKLSWLDLEILNDPSGKPEVHCSPSARKRFDNPRFLLSMSHSREFADTVVLWVRD